MTTVDVARAQPTPFVIVADLRTGSTLLHSSLDRHPDIRCYGELFHPDRLPDNQPDDPAAGRSERQPREASSGAELIGQAFAARGVDAVGFRAMIFLPQASCPQWADAWTSLCDVEGLRVICLSRRNRLAQYASMLIARKTNVYHPSSDDDPVLRPENRPTVDIDPVSFQSWIRERDALMERRRRQLHAKPTLEVEYETLTAAWTDTMSRVQEFLGVSQATLAQAKQKQESRPLDEVIGNYDQLAPYRMQDET